MFLVEYIQERKGKKFEYCSGYYDKDEALDFALKLNVCSNILGVTVSEIDVSFADIIYENNKEVVNAK